MLFLAFLLFSTTTSSVLELTDDNMASALESNEWVLVKFFAPWCGHCKQLAPEYLKIVETAKSYGVLVAEVDCTKEEEICAKYGVKGYPTLILFNKQEKFPYQGGRTSVDILNFLKKRTGRSLTLVNSQEELTTYMSDSFLIAHLSDPESQGFQEFKAASMSEDCQFLYVVDKSLLSSLSEDSSVIYYRNVDKKSIPYSGDSFTSAELSAFVDMNVLPGVVRLDRENSVHLFKENSKVLVVAIKFSDPALPEIEQFMLEAHEAAGKKIKTCLIDAENSDFEGIVEFFGFTEFPSFGGVTVDDKPNLFRPEKKSLDKDNIVDFAVKFANNQINRHVKVEPLPDDWDQLPVVVLTGENFDKVINSGKLVLVVFYAPWCGHCKNLMPILDKVAIHFEENDKLMFGKIDATKNDLDYDISGFPTLFLFHNGVQKVYTGARTFEELVSFMEENSAIEMAPPSSEEL